MRALIVDDDETSCQLLAKVFQRKGIEVDWSADSVAGYDKACQYPYDLFILDVRMPGLSGTDLAIRVKKMSPNAKIVLISAFADDALRKTATYLGVTVLSKPFTLEHLLEVTANLVCPPP